MFTQSFSCIFNAHLDRKRNVLKKSITQRNLENSESLKIMKTHGKVFT